MRGLTERQSEILSFIQARIEQDQIAPTYREIGRKFCITSTQSIWEIMVALQKKGAIHRITGQKRAIRLTRPHDAALVPA